MPNRKTLTSQKQLNTGPLLLQLTKRESIYLNNKTKLSKIILFKLNVLVLSFTTQILYNNDKIRNKTVITCNQKLSCFSFIFRNSAAERRRLAIQESKFLGGDMEHTHLVKGLDFALLQKVSFSKTIISIYYLYTTFKIYKSIYNIYFFFFFTCSTETSLKLSQDLSI